MLYRLRQSNCDCIELSAPKIHLRRVAQWLTLTGGLALFILLTVGCADEFRKALRTGDAVSRYFEVIAGYIIGLVFLAVVTVVSKIVFCYSQSYRWDRTDLTLTEVGPRWLLPCHKSEQTPFEDYKGVRLKIDRIARPPVLEYAVRYDEDWFSVFSDSVRDVNCGDEALDLLLRLGSISGFRYHAVHESTARSLTIEVFRNPRDEHPDIRPIPETVEHKREPSALALDSTSRPEEIDTSISAPAFHLDQIKDGFVAAKILECQPGQRIHIRHAPPAENSHMPMAIFFGLGTGVIAHELWDAPQGLPVYGVTCGLSVAILIKVIAAVITHGRRPEQGEVIMDWSANEFQWRDGGQWQSARLSNIEKVSLTGIKHDYQKSGSNYSSRLDVQIASREERICVLATEHRRESMAGAYDDLVPLTAALANSLNRPWVWHEADH